METLRYDYKPRAYVMVLSGLLFTGFGILLGKEASENDRGLILNGVIELGPRDATTFYWVLTALCGAFVLIALVGLARALGAPHEVVLDRTAITAPKAALARRVVTVPFAAITDLQIVELRSQKMLTIHHRDGKLTLARAMLPSRAAFEEIVRELDTRCRAVRGR